MDAVKIHCDCGNSWVLAQPADELPDAVSVVCPSCESRIRGWLRVPAGFAALMAPAGSLASE